MRREPDKSFFTRLQERYIRSGHRLQARNGLLSFLFIVISAGLFLLLFSNIGTSLFPRVDSGQTQVRLRLPVGTRLERTEEATLKLLTLAAQIAGKGNVEITSAFIGTQPSSYPINTIHLWTSGPHESVTKIKLKPGVIAIESFQEKLRALVQSEIPKATLSFEPGDLVEQVLDLGSNNPVEIAVVNRNLQQGRITAKSLLDKLSQISSLRDLQIATPLDYPTIKLEIDRVKAGQLNITGDQIARSTVEATSSSRFTTPSYWLDKSTGTAYQVQVQYPEYRMNSTEQLEMIPILSGNNSTHYLNEVATWRKVNTPGEYDRLNQQRYITITANIFKEDAGSAFKKVKQVHKKPAVWSNHWYCGYLSDVGCLFPILPGSDYFFVCHSCRHCRFPFDIINDWAILKHTILYGYYHGNWRLHFQYRIIDHQRRIPSQVGRHKNSQP
jgi:multidrug efflux pump subunit AcrB